MWQKVPLSVSDCLQKGNHWDIGFKASRGTGTEVEEDCLNTEEQRYEIIKISFSVILFEQMVPFLFLQLYLSV